MFNKILVSTFLAASLFFVASLALAADNYGGLSGVTVDAGGAAAPVAQPGAAPAATTSVAGPKPSTEAVCKLYNGSYYWVIQSSSLLGPAYPPEFFLSQNGVTKFDLPITTTLQDATEDRCTGTAAPATAPNTNSKQITFTVKAKKDPTKTDLADVSGVTIKFQGQNAVLTQGDSPNLKANVQKPATGDLVTLIASKDYTGGPFTETKTFDWSKTSSVDFYLEGLPVAGIGTAAAPATVAQNQITFNIKATNDAGVSVDVKYAAVRYPNENGAHFSGDSPLKINADLLKPATGTQITMIAYKSLSESGKVYESKPQTFTPTAGSSVNFDLGKIPTAEIAAPETYVEQGSTSNGKVTTVPSTLPNGTSSIYFQAVRYTWAPSGTYTNFTPVGGANYTLRGKLTKTSATTTAPSSTTIDTKKTSSLFTTQKAYAQTTSWIDSQSCFIYYGGAIFLRPNDFPTTVPASAVPYVSKPQDKSSCAQTAVITATRGGTSAGKCITLYNYHNTQSGTTDEWISADQNTYRKGDFDQVGCSVGSTDPALHPGTNTGTGTDPALHPGTNTVAGSGTCSISYKSASWQISPSSASNKVTQWISSSSGADNPCPADSPCTEVPSSKASVHAISSIKASASFELPSSCASLSSTTGTGTGNGTSTPQGSTPLGAAPWNKDKVSPYAPGYYKGAMNYINTDFSFSGQIPDNGTSSGLTINSLPAGQYVIVVSKQGYGTSEFTFTLADGEKLDLGGLSIAAVSANGVEAPSIDSGIFTPTDTASYAGKPALWQDQLQQMEGSSQGVLFAKKGGITYVYYPSLPWNGWVPIDPKKQTPAAKVSWSNQSPGIPTLMTETGQPSFGVSTGTGPANLPDATPCTTSTITNTTDKTGYLLGLGTILGSTMIKGNNTIKAVLQVAGGLQTAKSLVGNNTVNLTPCSQNLGTVTTPPQYQTSNGGISNAGLGAFANTNPAFANAANVLTSFGVHIPGLSP